MDLGFPPMASFGLVKLCYDVFPKVPGNIYRWTPIPKSVNSQITPLIFSSYS